MKTTRSAVLHVLCLLLLLVQFELMGSLLSAHDCFWHRVNPRSREEESLKARVRNETSPHWTAGTERSTSLAGIAEIAEVFLVHQFVHYFDYSKLIIDFAQQKLQAQVVQVEKPVVTWIAVWLQDGWASIHDCCTSGRWNLFLFFRFSLSLFFWFEIFTTETRWRDQAGRSTKSHHCHFERSSSSNSIDANHSVRSTKQEQTDQKDAPLLLGGLSKVGWTGKTQTGNDLGLVSCRDADRERRQGGVWLGRAR